MTSVDIFYGKIYNSCCVFWGCDSYTREIGMGSQTFIRGSKEGKKGSERDLLKSWHNEKDFLDRIVTGDESWFHYYEPETKSQSSQWKRKYEAPPVKVKCAPSAGKRMATVFWDREGILSIDWLPEKTTINSDYYVSELQELREAINTVLEIKVL